MFRPLHRKPLLIWTALCALFLAVEPALWLVRTWVDASWDSAGEVVFVGVVALLVRSVASGFAAGEEVEGRKHLGVALLAMTAVIRVVGHLLAVNVIGALALVLDVYAIALLLGVERRRKPLSPFWLAALFALAMPLERIIQRVIGFGLQQISAAGACSALSLTFDDVVCHGVDIVLAGTHVLVDLPCSGARGIVLLTGTFTLLAALSRPRAFDAGLGLALTLVAALASNTLRITMLAVGIAYRESLGIDVMAQPWHDIIGLLCLALGVLPLVAWSRTVASAQPAAPRPHRTRLPRWTLPAALTVACVAVLVTPHQPIDVARPVATIAAPRMLNGIVGTAIPLTARERDYFTKFGGAADKRQFGDHTLLLVQTSAPLRHLHAPDECLRGAGYDVQRLGISHGELPGAAYRAVAPDGTAWRVTVTYVSSSGALATSISEVVWRWLARPADTWTAVERASPWDAPPADRTAFDLSIASSLETVTLTEGE